jgi:hypothetical protein
MFPRWPRTVGSFLRAPVYFISDSRGGHEHGFTTYDHPKVLAKCGTGVMAATTLGPYEHHELAVKWGYSVLNVGVRARETGGSGGSLDPPGVFLRTCTRSI